ncbi:hypothetical protein RvY_17839 [Ramazzottius varieornatus]|uniref:Uncharacterized protein n=1 Tax=Ramazzottius varieornatus TaxID=947166 RepID=A0A1D1W3L3_RAMVA|nr:hypothetical protein RvY_17839 [Ramazzottius varieornatus]
MALIHSCCWWNNVTYGSYGSAVYSFLLGTIFTILVVYDVQPFHFFGHMRGENYAAVVVGSYLQVASGLTLCLTACTLAMGVFHAIRQLLLPWIISMFLFTLVLFAGNLRLLVREVPGSADRSGADALVILVSMVFCVLNAYGELCVISLYQNLCMDPSRGTKDVLPEKASVSYFRRGSYDTNDAWNQHAIIVAEAGGPSTNSIQILAHAARESMKVKTAVIPPPPLPPSTSTDKPQSPPQYASTSKQALSKLIPAAPRMVNLFNTVKQFRVQQPEQIVPSTQDKFIQVNRV